MIRSDGGVEPLRPVGFVSSSLRRPSDSPRQPDEQAPPATITLRADMMKAAAGLTPGDEILVLTWLHLADRLVLTTHPRDDPERQRVGVFATRSPDRPNPIGLHRTTIIGVDGNRIELSELEALDGTPVLDIKPVLGPIRRR